MAVVENRFVCDLSKPVQAQALKGNVFSLDNLGSRLSVLIYDNGQPATISGSVTANCILPDGSTVNVNGTLTTENGGSKAYIDVPQGCLLIPGILKIAIKCTSSSVITTLAAIVANVYMTKTDNVITPSAQIINDWNAEISAAIATQNAAIANQDTKINDLKSALANAVKYNLSPTTLPVWEKGIFKPTNGDYVSEDNYICNKNKTGMSTGVYTISAESGYLLRIFAWEGNTYKGTLKTNGKFSATVNDYAYVNEFNCYEFPDYTFKIAARRDPASTSIAISEGENIKYNKQTDETLSNSNKPADAAKTGEAVANVKSELYYKTISFTKVDGNVSKDENNKVAFQNTENWERTALSVLEGEKYEIQIGTFPYESLISYVFLCNDDEVVSSINNKVANVSQIETCYITIPSGINKIYIRSYETADTENALLIKKVTSVYEQEDIQKTKVGTSVYNGTTASGHNEIGDIIDFDSATGWKHTKIVVNEGEKYEFTYKSLGYATLIPYVYLCDKDSRIIQVVKNFMPSASYVEKIMLVIPAGIKFVYVRSYESDNTNISEIYEIQNTRNAVGNYPRSNKLTLDFDIDSSFLSSTVGSKISFFTANGWRIAHFDINPGEAFSIKFTTISYSTAIAYVVICDENDIVLERITNKYTSTSGIEEINVYGEQTYKRVYVRSYTTEPEVYRNMPSYLESVEIALKTRPYVYIACSNAPNTQKSFADIILDGATDEIVLQDVINSVCAIGGGTIKLSSGIVYINSFPNKEETLDDYVALMIPQRKLCQLFIEGDTLNGRTFIYVSTSCYESLNDNTQYTIIRGAKPDSQYTSASNIYFRMQDIDMNCPWNQKKIRFIDMLYCNKVLLERMTLKAFINGYDGHTVNLQNPPAVAVEGCEGIRATGGSNWGGLNDYRNIVIEGFHKGYRMAGEHMVCINCGAIWCVYGWVFGDYEWTGGSTIPMVFVKCYNERCVNFPLFDSNGSQGISTHTGRQALYFIGFSIERIADTTPGGVLGDYAKELYPGAFRGSINYTIVNQYRTPGNSIDIPFWENGSGHGMVSRNDAQLQSCNSEQRLSYAPNFMQRIWDTTLNKEVICINTENKTWVDTMGNVVD